MDDDLVSLARGPGMEVMVKRALGEQDERVGPLLLHRGHFLGNVCFLIQRLARRFERSHEHRALLGAQPAAEHHHTVGILIDLESAALVAVGLLTRFCDLVDPTPASDDPFDLTRAAGFAEREQPLLRLGRGDTGQRPDLGIGQLAPGECLSEPRQ